MRSQPSKRISRKFNLAPQVALFSLLVLSLLFSQYDASAPAPSAPGCLIIDNSGGDDQLGDEQDPGAFPYPFFSPEVTRVEAVTLVKSWQHHSQTSSSSRSVFNLRC
jgi:hypothetical protein